ncbi:hypothetical protein EVAR_43700_1 [Eumeta japonica]|uniref:Uncharacterized protein n=1 Tax=Eumeta variegata TaxID=151549 RepID=A0A4C1WWT7_EUMVA|nr:hypothetical protein EVAR_43700_1 [Eumeta japonica]
MIYFYIDHVKSRPRGGQLRAHVPRIYTAPTPPPPRRPAAQDAPGLVTGSAQDRKFYCELAMERKQTETVLERTYDEIEEEEDHNEGNNHIADDVEKFSNRVVSISTTEDDEVEAKENVLNFSILHCIWIKSNGDITTEKTRH